MDTQLDAVTVRNLIQTAAIAAIALLLFVGLRGRILKFAQWAQLPRLAMKPVRIAIRFSILLVAGIMILGLWGFQINGIVAFLGTVLGLVAIGFVAMWSLLSNFLCTIILIILKPFYVNDELELPTANVKGKVIDLSLVYTTLESEPGETILIPNNTFFQVIFKRRQALVRKDLEHQLRDNRAAA
ncbi:MAG: mechanosensitive ion channel [Opitutaceae bacterium]|nr:mechanosensitive ion channel [Opitutaceae bacterium]